MTMKTVGLSSGLKAQLVAVVMKETVVRIAVDEYYVKRKGHDEVQRWVRGRDAGTLSTELHINLQSPARLWQALRYQLRRYVWEEM